jgi:hypothetical protein
MRSRKFAIGDRVRVLFDTPSVDTLLDIFVVSRLLPANANVWEYRVTLEKGERERAVNEKQLQACLS